MVETSVKILLIEDNLAEARLLQEFLKQNKSQHFDLVHVKRLGDAFKQLHRNNFDVILLDLTLPDSEGLASLLPLINLAPTIPIVVLTNTNDDDLAIQAVRQGAQDYLVKRQVNPETLLRSLRYAIERKQTLEALRNVNVTLENSVKERTAELVKAKEINQEKSEFVSMLSHDIRNPLNTILLAAGLLQNNDERLSREKKISQYQLIRSAIKNMARLLDEASIIGKADSGKFNCEFTSLNLEAFCRELIEEAELLSSDKNVDIIFTSQSQLNEGLWDETLLRHILGNLLTNAVKYSPSGGLIKLELIGKEKQVIFKIQDRGIGIPKSDQNQLFQPFHRAGNVGPIPGTGLGLAIVKKCVEAYGGEILVDSEEGVGTTFIVILPLLKV